jgi:hypothetical protein
MVAILWLIPDRRVERVVLDDGEENDRAFEE